MYKKLVNNKKLMRYLRILLGACLIIWMLIPIAFLSRTTTSIATVNITKMVSSFVKQTSAQNLSIEQKQQKRRYMRLFFKELIYAWKYSLQCT
jgi:hypothetical protein